MRDFSAMHFTNFHTGKEKPEGLKNENQTDDILIDVDGWRETFRVGFYNLKDHQWEVYDKTVVIDFDDMVWTHLPLAIRDKKGKTK